MGTKLSPGRTDCYAAALPDEPMFVMLARDLAAPRMVRAWARDRENGIHAGAHPEGDREMIAEAMQCADDMDRWRAANVFISVSTPDGVWQGKRWHYEQSPESPEEWIAAFRGHIELQRQALARMEAENAELRGAMALQEQAIERLESQDTVSRHTIERLEAALHGRGPDAADIAQHLRDVAANMEARGLREVECASEQHGYDLEAYPQYAESIRGCANDLEALRPAKHLTFIVTDVARKVAAGLREIADEEEGVVAHTTWPTTRKRQMLRFVTRTRNLAAELEDDARSMETVSDDDEGPIADAARRIASYTDGAHRRNVYNAAKVELRLAAENAQPPLDLAEPPEINDHRFGHLEKHGDWAYARGLTVSPKHLPKALHQMEHDFGWRLLAIFGATDTQSIGFIFKRADATKVHLDIGANVDRAILEALTSKTATVAQILAESRTYRYDPDRGGKLDRLTESLSELHPDTAALVLDFTLSIAGRLRYVQEHHNLTDNWLRDDWEVDCVDRLYRNLRNCDYVDAAALLAFAWKREFTTIPQGGRIRQMKPGVELRMSGVDSDDWRNTRYRSGGFAKLSPSDRPFRSVDLAGEMVRPISRRSTGIMPAVALDQRGYIDPERELYAIRLRELAGFISPEEALDERITVLRATLDTLTKETGCAGLGRQQEP